MISLFKSIIAALSGLLLAVQGFVGITPSPSQSPTPEPTQIVESATPSPSEVVLGGPIETPTSSPSATPSVTPSKTPKVVPSSIPEVIQKLGEVTEQVAQLEQKLAEATESPTPTPVVIYVVVTPSLTPVPPTPTPKPLPRIILSSTPNLVNGYQINVFNGSFIVTKVNTTNSVDEPEFQASPSNGILGVCGSAPVHDGMSYSFSCYSSNTASHKIELPSGTSYIVSPIESFVSFSGYWESDPNNIVSVSL